MTARQIIVRALIALVVVNGLRRFGLEAPASAADAPNSGKTTGIVIEKTDKYMSVKAEGETEPKRYLLAPESGTPKAELQTALKTVFVPNLITLEWQGADKPVLTGLQVILPKARTGVLTGTVVGVPSKPKEIWFDVKPTGKGFTERYWPQWVGGPDGFDKKMIGTIGELNIGDKIKLGWSYDERKRVTQVQVTSKAKPADGESKAKTDQKP